MTSVTDEFSVTTLVGMVPTPNLYRAIFIEPGSQKLISFLIWWHRVDHPVRTYDCAQLSSDAQHPHGKSPYGLLYNEMRTGQIQRNILGSNGATS